MRVVSRTGLQALRYFLSRYLLRRPFLVAEAPEIPGRFRFKTEDAIGRQIFKRGTYEADVIDFLKSNLDAFEGDVILDVGANIGWYSVLFDRLSAQGVEIFAFEPDPRNFELLLENLRLNDAKKVDAIDAALSDDTGTRTLYIYPDKNRGRHSLTPSEHLERRSIRTITLDGFWRDHALGGRKVRLLKVDAEGHELFVFRGAAEVLQHCSAILMEISPSLMRAAGVETADLSELLSGAGFRAHRLAGSGLVPLDSLDDLVTGSETEILWLPSGAATAGIR